MFYFVSQILFSIKFFHENIIKVGIINICIYFSSLQFVYLHLSAL